VVATYNKTLPTLISPYGGVLIDLVVNPEERLDLVRSATNLPSIQLPPRFLCDLELLASGAFSPLRTFLSENDYRSVLESMRLADGLLFPIPIILPVPDAANLKSGKVALRNAHNNLIAVMEIEQVFRRDPLREAQAVCGTLDPAHPLVSEMRSWGEYCLSGPLRVLELPKHYDFADLRQTPAQIRRRLEGLGNSRVVAFQTRNPMHRVHEELTRRASEAVDATLLLHPVVGVTKPGDVDYFTRVNTYKAVYERYYSKVATVLGLVPLAMRMAGPREALWHAIVRRNFGASHFIVGRDHASPGVDSNGRCFYPPRSAIELLEEHGAEIGVTPLAYPELVYLPAEDRYEEVTKVPAGAQTLCLSGTDVRKFLTTGRRLPEWYIRPEAADILERAFPPRTQQGICVWFTGLPSAGKSTIAEIVALYLAKAGRRITLLDGDVVRTHLSKGLGFSREDRDTNIRRIGFVSAEIVRHGGTAICAAVSPYETTRNEVRRMVGENNFLLIYVATSPEICEARDVKGMYAKARAGALKGFTGVDDPYEAPGSPDLVLTTIDCTAEEAAREVIRLLVDRGFLTDGD
jgi:sulfate adenylyltransferase